MTSRSIDRARALRGLAVTMLLALPAAGCKDHTGLYGNPVPETSIAARHPVYVPGDVVRLDLPVATASRHLYRREVQQLTLYLDDYARTADSSLTVSTPAGTMNEAAAVQLAAEIRALALHRGISEAALAFTSYVPQGPLGEPYPIVLEYQVLKTVLPECGVWTEDLASDHRNRPYRNFGCAQSRNLGAMIADPADLVGPRPQPARDSTRRDVVFDKYRKGEPTGAVKPAGEQEQLKNAGG